MSTDAHNDAEWYVEGNPHWPYDKWIKTYFLKPLQYAFVRDTYERTLDQLCKDLARSAGSKPWLLDAVDRSEEVGVGTLWELVERVSSKEDAERFLEQAAIPRDHLEALLDFVKRWIIPVRTQLRQLFDTSDEALMRHFEALKQFKLTNSFALLEHGRTKAGRRALAEQTGVPEEVILDFVHRADITRLPFVSGRVVKQLWALGYTSLEQLRAADPEDYFARMAAHYEAVSKGKPFDATPQTARGLIEGARRLPTVVEA